MFHCSVGSSNYAEIYRDCSGYSVTECHELPSRICHDCENKLISFHNFRLSIEKVEERLAVYQAQMVDEFHIEDQPGTKEINVIEEVEADQESYENQFYVEEIYEEDEVMFDEDHLHNDEDVLEANDDYDQTCEEEVSTEIVSEEITGCRFKQSTIQHKQVKCTVCSEECEAEKSINELMQSENLPVTCECGKVLKNRRSFLKHYSTIHKRKETSFPCRHCNETLNSSRSRVAHEASVHSIGLKFSCSTCTKKFYRSDHWKEHEKICNKIDDPSLKFFSCTVCLFTFQREETYKKHLETAHPGVTETDKQCIKKAEEYSQRYSNSKCNQSQVLSDTSEVKEKSQPKSLHICTICDKLFKNDEGLQKHRSLFHTGQVWSCEKCDAVFIHRSTKISHMSKEHGSRKPFECSYTDCSFSCFKKDRFNAHIEKHENPDKMFPCPICQQEFKSYNTMTLHRARHLSKNTYVCSTCCKQFLDKRNYNVHCKLHTGEDLHHCPVCDRGFNRKDHLQKHQERKKHFDKAKHEN